MRTERFRQILENSRKIDPKRFASENGIQKVRASVCWFHKTIEPALFLRFLDKTYQNL